MTIEKLFVLSKIFMVCAVVLLLIAVAFYFIFDVKRLIKILRGKTIKPLLHKKPYENKKDKKERITAKDSKDNKTEILKQSIATMKIGCVHSDAAL